MEKEKVQVRGTTLIVFILLMFFSLIFVNWVSRMAYENTCIELEKQFIDTEVSEIIDTMESSINFGKELDNYYGMNEVMESIQQITDAGLEAVVMDAKGQPLYLSFSESDDNKRMLAGIYAADYQKQLAQVTERGEAISTKDRSTLVYPICKNGMEKVGYLAVLYQAKDLIVEMQGINPVFILAGIVVAAAAVLLLLYKFSALKKYVPVIFTMLAIFGFIVFLFQTYQQNYNHLIRQKAQQTANSIQGTLDGILEKGLDIEELYRINEYLEKKAQMSGSIQNIQVIRSIAGDIQGSENSSYIIRKNIGNDQGQLMVEVSQSYIQEKIQVMALTFGAVFVVCLMLAYELLNMAEVISIRISPCFQQRVKEMYQGISAQIRLVSFLCFTAIYTSLPYAAVIMRKWDTSVFGFSKGLSASLPLTVELVSVLVASAFIQKVYSDLRLERFMIFVFPFLILGNLACTVVNSPYMLIGLRAFCGIGFAFLKYWLNCIVAAGSEDEDSFSENCGRLNAGLLGGITAGASLGAILAEALGYQSNYLFTAVIMVGVLIWTAVTMPWKMLSQTQTPDYEAEGASADVGSLSRELKNPKAVLTLLLGCVPLNIGLMYVVAFVPSYMSNIGQSAIATSYVYLVNGLAGIYLGMFVLRYMKKKSLFFSSACALFLAAGGMLVLLLNKSLGIVMVSAGVLGLFDGFGTPSITSYFTGFAKDKSNTPGMLTIFNMTGSAVQILCPMLYNLLIQPNGKMTYLMIFGGVYLTAAVMFLLFCRTGPAKKQA